MKIFLLCCSSFWVLFLSPSVLHATEVIPSQQLLLFLQPQTFPPFAGVMPFFHEEARTLSSGEASVQSAVLYFNTFRQDSWKQDESIRFFLDMEGAAWCGEWRYSPLEDWELSGQVQILGVYNGFLDPWLALFHSAFGFPNQSREFFPENEFHWSLIYRGKELIDPEANHLSLSQYSVSLKYVLPWRWSIGGRLGMKAWLKPPVPSEGTFFNTQAWSAGWGFLYSEFWNPPGWRGEDGFRWGLSLGGAMVQPDVWRLPGRLLVYQGGFHGGLMWNGCFFGLQGSLFQAPFDVESYYLGVRSGEIHLGVKGPAGPVTWEVALVEELLTWGTMEVGFQGGLSWTF